MPTNVSNSRSGRRAYGRAAQQSGAATASSPERGKPASPGTGKGGDAEPAKNELWEWIKSIFWAVLLFFVIRTFLITAYSIPSESMEGSLLVGDYLMANNAVFGATIPFTDIKLPALRDPRRGEIVVFRPTYNEPQIDVVKRVLGVPGDTLWMADRVLYRNGRPVNEPYAQYTKP